MSSAVDKLRDAEVELRDVTSSAAMADFKRSLAEAIDAVAIEIQERDKMLARWLVWPGRSEDEVQPIERETMKLLGHADECELAEYGACTCPVAAT